MLGVGGLFRFVLRFYCWVLDAMLRLGVLSSGMVLSSRRLVFLLGVLDHVLHGVLQPRAPVDFFLVMMLGGWVLRLRCGLRVGSGCLVLRPIVDDADARFERFSRCSVGGVCLLVGDVHGVAVHPFHGEGFAVYVLLHG